MDAPGKSWGGYSGREPGSAGRNPRFQYANTMGSRFDISALINLSEDPDGKAHSFPNSRIIEVS